MEKGLIFAMETLAPQFTVSDFVAITNQVLETAYPTVVVVGEVTEFKISQGKWVSFKLKDEESAVSCFMGIYSLRQPLEDGMKVSVVAAPRLNKRGYFTLNVRTVSLVGEGTIKKGFELLKAKLEAEGLFAPERKRPLPRVPKSVAVVTSTESAAYADFCKIVNERWGGLSVQVAHTQVQGEPAADQIIRAIRYFNGLEVLPEVLVIIRGGGSAEDLMTFNDEPLARAIAESRIPTMVGVGHEVDHSLADMVADRRASTPTNAAELLVPDKQEIIRAVRSQVQAMGSRALQAIDEYSLRTKERLDAVARRVNDRLADAEKQLAYLRSSIRQLDPRNVLERGYAMIRGEIAVGAMLQVETAKYMIETEIIDVREK